MRNVAVKRANTMQSYGWVRWIRRTSRSTPHNTAQLSQHTTHNTQHTQHTTHTTYNTQRTTHTTHSTPNTQHTHNTQHTQHTYHTYNTHNTQPTLHTSARTDTRTWEYGQASLVHSPRRKNEHTGIFSGAIYTHSSTGMTVWLMGTRGNLHTQQYWNDCVAHGNTGQYTNPAHTRTTPLH